MLPQGIQMLALMEGGAVEGPHHMGMLGAIQAMWGLAIMSVVVMVTMEQQGGTVRRKGRQAGVLPLALTSLHIHQPLTGLPGQHSAAEDTSRFLPLM